jgi:hypothetical protein
MHHVTRGYFGLQDNDYATEPIPRCWFYGPNDGLVLDVPPRRPGWIWAACGARVGETTDVTSAFSARVTIYLTVVTSVRSNVTMMRA